MSKRIPRLRTESSLSLKVGHWFEAQATGWGLVVLPLVLGALLTAALLKWFSG
ncbi:hypothetical protein [Phenylobacterium sp.]|jgi:hypothetical protein|uniref:hypothetical protein n=1 Tax=Phenylobacterium sp. TaxID=1871053 RepID=UPI002E378837|nr:hypothetical protein [Phenylobacterium sp.]HEX4710447.1 hypothetical protein [Phenylobacterium sp.]